MALPSDDAACRRPEIEYPCRWEYKTIGPSAELMRQAVGQVMLVEGLEYALEASNSSRGGKYHSLCLAVTVASEDHRNRIFASLSAHDDIVFVL